MSNVKVKGLCYDKLKSCNVGQFIYEKVSKGGKSSPSNHRKPSQQLVVYAPVAPQSGNTQRKALVFQVREIIRRLLHTPL